MDAIPYKSPDGEDERHQPRYKLYLRFEWGGGCLWAANAATQQRFPDWPIERFLSSDILSPGTRKQLLDLEGRHDSTGMHWGIEGCRPFTHAEYKKFEQDVERVLAAIRQELGPDFEIVYIET